MRSFATVTQNWTAHKWRAISNFPYRFLGHSQMEPPNPQLAYVPPLFYTFRMRSGCVPEHPSTFVQTMEELLATSYARHRALSLEPATQGTTNQIVGNWLNTVTNIPDAFLMRSVQLHHEIAKCMFLIMRSTCVPCKPSVNTCKYFCDLCVPHAPVQPLPQKNKTIIVPVCVPMRSVQPFRK